ncbi:MAG: hypothetical protein H6Q48_2575 [Deltaproteobacteria bacterium]|nr:hypothetical protein [Deltaproteobacteria bacterium]
MKHKNLLTGFLVATLLFFQAWPLTAAETANKTVLLKVHVPFAGG